MSGAIYDGTRTRALRTEADGVTPGPRVALARHAHARLDCGAVTFLVAPAEPAAAVPAAPFPWRAIENRYHLGTALGVAMLLLLLMMTPADPHALAFDVFSTEHGMVKFEIKPPVVPVLPEIVPGTGQTQPASGQAAKGPSGAAGSEAARERNRRLAIKGSSQEMRVAQAPQPIDARNAGVLGILQRSEVARSIFERTSALGPDAEDVLGNLIAAPIGLAYGPGGLGGLGTGRGGVGTGEGTIGIAVLGGGGPGIGPGGIGWRAARVAGTLGTRHPTIPNIIIAEGHVRGNLDREIIRRIIRRHINEVRFCYEQQLAMHHDLAGRMVVQFNIAPTGQVLSSVLQSSTLGNVRVEACALQAVRRWEFPKPEGGGLVNVSYPFVFAPAGGGAN
jgi:TonB family protein